MKSFIANQTNKTASPQKEIQKHTEFQCRETKNVLDLEERNGYRGHEFVIYSYPSRKQIEP